MDTITEIEKPMPAPPARSKAQSPAMGQTEIRIKGVSVLVPSVNIDGRDVISTGSWMKVATIHDEELAEGELVRNPEHFIEQLKASKLRADIFTFAQKLPETAPKYKYRQDWDNIAVIPIGKYADWWEKRVDPGVRRAVRKAAKSGIEVRVAELDDEFVQGIANINNETPIRQGKPFWHYRKSCALVKKENDTYSERNIFLGAYLEGQLIGFVRMTRVDGCAHILQILSMIKHYEKRPANAMIAKAVEVCEQRGLSNLIYCNYVYNDPNSTLTEFKRRNGFEKVELPRYYIPLTLKGRILIALGLHRGLVKRIPQPLLLRLLKARTWWYERRSKSAESQA